MKCWDYTCKFYQQNLQHFTKLQIQSNCNGLAVKGEPFDLTCLVEIPSSDYLMQMSWKTPLNDYVTGLQSKNQTHFVSVLTVTDAQENDGGNYVCTVENDLSEIMFTSYSMAILKDRNPFLNISQPNNIYEIHENASYLNSVNISVSYQNFPTPISLQWYTPDLEIIQQTNKYDIIYEYKMITLIIKHVTLSDTGNYTLKANNGYVEKELYFSAYIRDEPKAVAIDLGNGIVEVGKETTLKCTTIGYPRPEVFWSYIPCNNNPKWPSCIEENEISIDEFLKNTHNVTEIETIHELNFKPDGPGKVKCAAYNDFGFSSVEGLLLIGDITDNMTVYRVDGDLPIVKGDEVNITCAALAYYYSADDLVWFKDGQQIINGSGIEIEPKYSNYSYKKVIKFKNIGLDNAGNYECRAGNKSDNLYIFVKDLPSLTKEWLIGTLLVDILIIVFIYWGIQVYTEKKLEKKFRRGDPDLIDYKKPLNSQALYLPYDVSYEIDPRLFELGDRIGRGNFGVIYKGVKKTAPGKGTILCAVKTVNQCPEKKEESYKTLVCELKIMVHLGKHLNVVGLLGAVTKNIPREGLMVLTEYCPFGDLKNYLLKHRIGFIDQIDPNTDQIDEKINGIMPGYESLNGNKNIKTIDLVEWAFQVACGMKHLSSKNVLHNDLAARNILLCDNNVVKICDFGLSRSLPEGDGIYHKQTEECISIRWVALEALNKQTFNTYTDVWSFGIVLWEFFSMAKEPYHDITTYETLKTELNAGYRLGKPPYANEELYNLMLECWDANPDRRPKFDLLKAKFASMLKDEAIIRLYNLNEEFLERDDLKGQLNKMLLKTPRKNFVIKGFQYCWQRFVAMFKYVQIPAPEHELQSLSKHVLEAPRPCTSQSVNIIMSEEAESIQDECNEGTESLHGYEQMNSATDSLLPRRSENDGLLAEDITTPQMSSDCINILIFEAETEQTPVVEREIVTNENYLNMKAIKKQININE